MRQLPSHPGLPAHRRQERGDETLSLKLGLQGTFIFAAISLTLAATLSIAEYYFTRLMQNIIIFIVCTAPVLTFFSWWQLQIRQTSAAVNYENTMRMNHVSSLCMSAAFLLMLIWPALF